MIRTYDDADVGRSVARYRALGAAYARLAHRLGEERKALRARIAPLEAVMANGGAQSRAIVAGGPTARMIQRTKKRLAYLAGRLDVIHREARYWLSAIDRILELHREEAARGMGWKAPVCHDPSEELPA